MPWARERQRPAAAGAATVLFAGRNRGQDENLIFPDDRRRRAKPGDLQFPFYIFGLAPFRRRRALRSSAVDERSAPLRPVPVELLAGRWRRSGGGQQRGEGESEGRELFHREDGVVDAGLVIVLVLVLG